MTIKSLFSLVVGYFSFMYKYWNNMITNLTESYVMLQLFDGTSYTIVYNETIEIKEISKS